MKTKSLFLTVLASVSITTGILAADTKKAHQEAPQSEHGTKHSEHKPSPMEEMISDKSGAEFEAAFLGMMIHHHENGLMMWKMVPQKATSDVLKDMDKKSIPKDQEEIGEMTGWLKQWHSKTPQDFTVPEESRKMMEKDMAELQTLSGEKFDKAFAEKMAMHHMSAIGMAKMAKEKAQHEPVKDLAQNIVESQRDDHDKLMKVAKANHHAE